RYVSTVDSGNLAGHLLTLRPGLAALVDARILDRTWFQGLGDTLRTLADAVGPKIPEPLVRLQKDLDAVFDDPPATIVAARGWLDRIEVTVAEIAAHLAASPDQGGAVGAARAREGTFWAAALVRQSR